MRYWILFLAIFSFCCAEAREFNQVKISNSKNDEVYPEPDQLFISSGKIRIQTPSKKSLISGKLIFLKDGRLCASVKKAICVCKRGPCRIHKVWHRACGGCGVLICPGNCTCYDWRYVLAHSYGKNVPSPASTPACTKSLQRPGKTDPIHKRGRKYVGLGNFKVFNVGLCFLFGATNGFLGFFFLLYRTDKIRIEVT